MSSHAKPKSKIRSVVTSASVFSFSIGSLVALAPASQAQLACVSDANIGMTATAIEGGTICEVIFLPTGASPQAVNWTPPTGVGKVSALVIGAGTAAVVSNDNNYAAAGASGIVTYVDDVGDGQLTITAGVGQAVGDGSYNDAGDGYSTLVGTATTTSWGGFKSQIDPGGGYPIAQSGNNQVFNGGDGTGWQYSEHATSGAGTAGNGSEDDKTASIPGGLGTTAQALNADPQLWPNSFTTVFGQGGSYFSSSAGANLILTATVQGLGYGGSATLDTSVAANSRAQAGANGSIRIRYAIGSSAPAAIPAVSYEGPTGIRQVGSSFCSGATVVVTGNRMDTITGVEVAGQAAIINSTSATRLEYTLPTLAAGTYAANYRVPASGLTLMDKVRVTNCSETVSIPAEEVDQTPFNANRLFANFRGDRGAVVGSDLSAITAFINRYQGIQRATCVGSTSGIPAISTDQALAETRAKNACDVVKRLVPDAEITLRTSTGKGVGQNFRSVQIFVSGTR